MTLTTVTDNRFDFDAADRLRKALRTSDVSVQEMADYLEVSRNSVSAWINGRNFPRRRDLVRFAAKTGYPVEWLRGDENVAESQPSDYLVETLPAVKTTSAPRTRIDQRGPRNRSK